MAICESSELFAVYSTHCAIKTVVRCTTSKSGVWDVKVVSE